MPIKLTVDSGATVNVLGLQAYERISRSDKNIKLKKTKTTLYSYNSNQPLNVLGCFETVVETSQNMAPATFYVINGKSEALLGIKTAKELEILKINIINQLQNSTEFETKQNQIRSKLKQKYPEVFGHIGKLKDSQVTLHIDSSVNPVAQRPRPYPFHIS